MHKLPLFLKQSNFADSWTCWHNNYSRARLPFPRQSSAVNESICKWKSQNQNLTKQFICLWLFMVENDIVVFHTGASPCFQVLPINMNAQGSSHGLSLSAHLQKPINYRLTANENVIDNFVLKHNSVLWQAVMYFIYTWDLNMPIHLNTVSLMQWNMLMGFNKYSIKTALKFIYWTLWKLRALPANPPQRTRAVQSRSSDTGPRARKFN